MSLEVMQNKLKDLHPDKSKKELKEMAQDVFFVAREIIEENDRFNMPEFGVFTKKERKGRKVKVPNSEVEVEVPTQETVTFKPSKGWKEDMNPASIQA